MFSTWIYLNSDIFPPVKSEGCETRLPQGFTNVYSHLNWIKDVTGLDLPHCSSATLYFTSQIVVLIALLLCTVLWVQPSLRSSTEISFIHSNTNEQHAGNIIWVASLKAGLVTNKTVEAISIGIIPIYKWVNNKCMMKINMVILQQWFCQNWSNKFGNYSITFKFKIHNHFRRKIKVQWRKCLSSSLLLRMFVRKSSFQTQIFSKCYFFERIHSTVLKFGIVVLLSRSPAPSIYKIRSSESEMKETKENMFTISFHWSSTFRWYS